MDTRRRARFPMVCVAAFAGALSCSSQLPPETQAVVVVDTDLPAPIAAHVRIDLFAADGTWFDTREVVRASARDWPVSFGVVSPRAAPAVLRVRVSPEGYVRDYHGGIQLMAPSGAPTPPTEPDPDVTVDRLVRIEFARDAKRTVRVDLRGDCAGMEAKLALGGGKLDAAASESCVTTPRTRSALENATPTSDAARGTSRVGTWAAAACAPGTPDGRICVPGGAFVFGEALRFDDFSELPAASRIFAVGRFLMDAREVTVGEYRAALARGFVEPEPARVNDAPLVADPVDGCSFTSAPGDREALAMTCVPWATARAYCTFAGGDLPTEAEWEYAATAAGKELETSFPWGDEPPTCERAAYGRAFLKPAAGVCQSIGSGPLPAGVPAGDRTPLGILALAGGVTEWMRDAAAPLDAACWSRAPIDAWCDDEASVARSLRGGGWAAPPPVTRSTLRLELDRHERRASLGFRCVVHAP